MNTTTQTINTTMDFDRWWRETGQFLQPCDAADDETREQFRLFASSMYGFEDNYYRVEFERADKDLDDTKYDLETVESREQTLIDDLNQVLSSPETDAQKLREIESLLK